MKAGEERYQTYLKIVTSAESEEEARERMLVVLAKQIFTEEISGGHIKALFRKYKDIEENDNFILVDQTFQLTGGKNPKETKGAGGRKPGEKWNE